MHQLTKQVKEEKGGHKFPLTYEENTKMEEN